jgi:hypothetical protein
MKGNKHIQTFEQHQENLNISDVMNSVLEDLYNELSELNNVINDVDTDRHEYYLGRIKGVESSIQIVEKHCS